MKSLKVVFFGTPEFAKAALDAITNSRHQVVGVVTVADKQAGRGQKVTESAVKKLALEKKIPLYQPEKLRNPEFLNQIKFLGADVFVVVAFRMMPKVLFEMPKLGTFNLHASLLPDYRGAAPINYAIINGETETGATTFFINEKIDEGNILLQKNLQISPDESAGELHDRLMELGAELVVETLDGLAENALHETPQPAPRPGKDAFKIFKKDTEIDWGKKSVDVHNFVRGMSPYPAAFSILNVGNEGKTVKILSGNYSVENHGDTPGTLHISKDLMKIATADGYYFPSELQPEGKKKMPVRDFLNGLRL